MRPDDVIKWFEELGSQANSLRQLAQSGISYYETEPASIWAAGAESAIAAVFPPGHVVRGQWRDAISNAKSFSRAGTINRLKGIFFAAADQVRAGRITGLAETVRAETVSELLEQAEVLASANHLPAAVVIGGGGLETFLRHYVDRNGLKINGEGSISKYNGVVGKARNDGIDGLYSANEGKQVEAWGGTRNDASHLPGEFDRSQADVRRMIEGIREFLARHAEH